MAMDEEALLTPCKERKKGGKKTLPFVIGAVVGNGLATYAVMANYVVYLVDQYKMDSVDAAQIGNIMGSSTNLAPVFGAIAADTCLGCFNIISVSSAAGFLAMLLFTLTAAFNSLRPHCFNGICEEPTIWQLAVLYTATSLLVIGLGGTRLAGATMGAAQLDSPSEQASFFSWYLVALYMSAVIGTTGVVYFQDHVGWVWGFTLCTAVTAVGLVFFLLGNFFYRHPERQENPFVVFVRDIFSPAKRRRMSSEAQCYYDKLEDEATNLQTTSPYTSSAIEDGKRGELHMLLKLTPIITIGIFLNIYVSIQSSLMVLQIMVMDRHVFAHFTIPIASVSVFSLLGSALSVPLLEYVIYPLWRRIAGHMPTHFQRIGLGMILKAVPLAYLAVIESRRLDALEESPKPMSVLWLVPSLVISGFGEAMHFPGQLAFFYQEFPASLQSTATGVHALQSGIGSYLGTALIEVVRRTTGWLQQDANHSRLDYVYWMGTVLGLLNFGCFLLCVRLYKKRGGA